jgi:hypothetical protein
MSTTTLKPHSRAINQLTEYSLDKADPCFAERIGPFLKAWHSGNMPLAYKLGADVLESSRSCSVFIDDLCEYCKAQAKQCA